MAIMRAIELRAAVAPSISKALSGAAAGNASAG